MLECTIDSHSCLISFVLLLMNCVMAPQEVICLYLSSGLNSPIPILSETKAINRLMSWLFQKNVQHGNSFLLTQFWTYAPVMKGSNLDTGKSASDTCGHSCGYHYDDSNSNLLDLPNVQLLAICYLPTTFISNGCLISFSGRDIQIIMCAIRQ